MRRLGLATVIAVLGLALFGAAVPSTAQTNVVETSSGSVRGARESNLTVFRGIPYAAAPVGEGRWRPPQPAPSWQGVRQARDYGPICPQIQGEGEYALREGAMSEDCLTVNVWTPEARSGADLPVMVWIHGGGFKIGAGGVPLYDGAALARRGVVVVTLNYRLGLLGVFAHPDLAAEQPDQPRANYAIMDQIAALEWVRDNIAAFGGDPRRVTIFGESAGGVSVLLHMISPRSRQLFSQAIVQSGGGWTRSPTLQQGEEIALRSAQELGAANLSDLRAVAPERLVEVLQRVSPGLGFTAVVDGEIVPETIPDAFGAGRVAPIPLLIGSNTYEQSLLAMTGLPMRSVLTPLPPMVVAGARSVYGEEARDDDVLGGALFRDGGFTAPARWIARHNGAQAYYYRYAHVRVARRGETPGPGHGAEIPYVFDSLRAISPAAQIMFRAEDRQMAEVIGDCWVSFARAGVPACGSAQWSPVSHESDDVMIFDRGRAQYAPDPWSAQLRFQDQVFEARNAMR